MPAITGSEIVTDAFSILNVFMLGQTIPAKDASFGLRFLNDMLSEMAQRRSMIPFISREVFNLVANQGGPTNPYTIGVGGNFNTQKPANQNSIVSANLILTATTPNVRVPLGIYTTDAYDANALPDLSNTQPTGLYYNPTYSGNLGTINIWPVPTIATNTLELFIQKSVAQFADLTTPYYVPDSLPKALKYNLADGLQTPYGRTLSQAAQRLAVSSMGTFTRSNHQLSDVMNDAYMFSAGRNTLYNINTGSGG